MLPFLARVDLRAMTMKGCSLFPKAPSLEPHHQIVLCHIQYIRWWGGSYSPLPPAEWATKNLNITLIQVFPAIIWFKVTISKTNNWCTVIWFQVFLLWNQVFLIWFQVFLILFQVFIIWIKVILYIVSSIPYMD